jgi:hypothetical protein
MDIIAAHQQGLIEQLQEEVAAIAGRPRDHAQRAIVLHHLFDHSRGAHHWALTGKADRWGWLNSRREESRRELDGLAGAIGEVSRARCAAAYLAYRLSATPALRGEASQRLNPELLEVLDRCHAARRSREDVSGEIVSLLAEQSEKHALASVDAGPVSASWASVGATWLGRAACRLLGPNALDRAEARDRKRGWSNVERNLRGDPLLPASFRSNPAQHFYALQLSLAERRRQRWREACDRELGAFELAA